MQLPGRESIRRRKRSMGELSKCDGLPGMARVAGCGCWLDVGESVGGLEV